MHKGVITNVCGNSAYEVYTGDYHRIYNQSNLKRRYSDVNNDDDSWQTAYDEAAAKSRPDCDTSCLCPETSFPEVEKRREGRYFLRKNRTDPKVYRT